MIGYLSGTVIESEAGVVLLDVGGVGYKVFVTQIASQSALSEDSLSVYTHHVVREQALDLYGFKDKKELQFFELLISISGIGPKVALSILNVALPETLFTAVKEEDSSILTKVSGIGKKNAEKIILELKNKVDIFAGDFEGQTHTRDDVEVFEALEALGFDVRSVQQVLKEEDFNGLDTGEKIKRAIKLLGK